MKSWRNQHSWQCTCESEFRGDSLSTFYNLARFNFKIPFLTLVTRKRHLFYFDKKQGSRYRNPCTWALVFISLSVTSPTLCKPPNLRSSAWNTSKNYPHRIMILVQYTYYTGKVTTLFTAGHKSPWPVSVESLLLKVPESQTNNTVLPQHGQTRTPRDQYREGPGREHWASQKIHRKQAQAWPKRAVSNIILPPHLHQQINKNLLNQWMNPSSINNYFLGFQKVN